MEIKSPPPLPPPPPTTTTTKAKNKQRTKLAKGMSEQLLPGEVDEIEQL